MKRLIPLAALALVSACAASSGKDAQSADDVATKASLEAGTTVCLASLVGVRYELEDVLREQELEPEHACMMADVQLEEQGEPSAWVMRYQRVGDSDWLECKSGEDDRAAFAEQCISQMIADLGGS